LSGPSSYVKPDGEEAPSMLWVEFGGLHRKTGFMRQGIEPGVGLFVECVRRAEVEASEDVAETCLAYGRLGRVWGNFAKVLLHRLA
jgi:hypothetical protein